MKNGLSEVEVWNLFRSGDKSAFEFIYQEYFDKLFNYGCQFTGDHALVEDGLQELFVELWRRREHLSETNRILPYLYRAFRRKIIRERDKQTQRISSLEAHQPFSVSLNIEAAIIKEESRKAELLQLQQALEDLPERYREMVFLFFYENLTYEEIQEIQGFENVKSARNLLYKALKSLRKKVKGLYVLLSMWVFMGA